MCANFSQAHTAKAGKGIETADDLSAAIAIAEAIRQLQPRVFTLENVLRYQNSQSFSIILSALELEGYSVDYSVVSMDKFGLLQARRRLVLVASRGFRVALPSGATPCGWYTAIAHLIKQKLSITEVSYLVGFQSQSHFAKVFRKHVGITPLAYQRQIS
ncbi:C-5 cytosine-specific DNA methylase [Nostoc commune NIES-4072]|uniref:C-5 cytosine-specific DNA methylase n=1 Tax=Nostoc commune NIES-4072 TaxID=2005467 RepID=A0A2R5FWR9_NOSCO|nr:C-5 cytosine-specific DNA methylase [Nostoc commune HK-02]GBG23187.1 C-5 cytosine-specific DNA methylase [Nostoc commune NIES-4072]